MPAEFHRVTGENILLAILELLALKSETTYMSYPIEMCNLFNQKIKDQKYIQKFRTLASLILLLFIIYDIKQFLLTFI